MDAALNVKFGADTTALIAGVQKVEVTLLALQNRLKALQAERLTIVDPTRLEVVNRQIDGITGQIAKLKAQGTESFAAVSKQVDGVVESNNKLVSSVNSGYSAIRKLAFILPGIGIAGIFNLAFEAISKLVGETEKLDEVLSKIKSNQGVIAEAVGGTAGDIARVEALAAAVQNTNLTYKERENALARLKEINKSYFGDLSLEADSLKILSARVQEYAQALIQEAIVKGFTEEITKQTIEYNKQSDSLKILKNNLDNAIKAQQGFKDVPIVAGGRGGGTGTSDAALQQNKLAAAVNLARDAFVKQRDTVELIGTAIANYTDKVQGAIAESLKLKPLKSLDEGSGAVIDTLSKTEQALKEIIKLEDELAKPNELPLFQRLANSLDVSRAQLLSTKIAQVLRDNIKNGIDQAITNKEVGLLQEQLRRLLDPNLKTVIDARVEINPIVEKDVNAFEVLGKIGPQLTDVMDKLPPIKTDIKVDPNLVADNVKFANQLADLQATIANTVAGVAVGIAEGIGRALAGGKNPFAPLLQLLGDGLEEIGKKILIVGGISQLIQDLLPTIFTPAGVATSFIVGALAIAAGAALKAISSQKGVKAFAEGGIVTGPTNALIGEAGPEVVFPLEKLNRFIKGNTTQGSMEIYGQTVISGPNLITVFKRAQNNQGMVG